MIVLALLEIDEMVACNLVCEVAAAGVPVRQRTRRLVERVLAERPEAARARWATLARQDRERLDRRARR